MVDAAVAVIESEGGNPEQITLREVSRRVGVNHRAAYRHFEDKIALLAAVAEEGYRALLIEMQQSVSTLKRATPERRLRAIASAYVAYAIDHPSQYRIMFGRRLNEDGRFPVLEDLIDAAYRLLATEMNGSRDAVFGFWSLAHGFATLTLARRIKVKRSLLESWAQQVFEPFFAGLRP
jgi:AcrR family transcriptional regulator